MGISESLHIESEGRFGPDRLLRFAALAGSQSDQTPLLDTSEPRPILRLRTRAHGPAF
jgi:hypothetical protein